ncbi:MAG: acetylglutamate kinase [Planctomycetota bacterium]|nr:acetylglutamate kinase [Planctomycetota bacterium]
MNAAGEKAAVLIEALPYLKAFDRKFVIIKLGGSAMEDPAVFRSVITDVVFLEQAGMWPVLVHGGGPRITAAMEKAGIKPVFVEGRRVTDEATIEIAHRVLIDEISFAVCRAIEEADGKAIPLNGRGSNFLRCEKLRLKDRPDIDLGYVGEITAVDAELCARLSEGSVIPVVAPIARGPDGRLYNVNADSVAWKVAAEIRAEKIVFLSNVDGVMRDMSDPSSVLSTMDMSEAERLIREKIVTGGMIPKVQACLSALKGGVRKAHIINALTPHAMLLEIFTDRGIGTEIRA